MSRLRDLFSRGWGAEAEPGIAAAVCFRQRDGRPEFLLVRTSDGARWTFPKGRRERGESLARSAAREAAEEAGVSGDVCDDGLGEYRHAPSHHPDRADDAVAAFLLEVSSAGEPDERGREPTWFGAAQARDRLAEARDGFYAQELARVLVAAERELRRRPPAGRSRPQNEPLSS
ncbi:MAG: NUDIX domain-containing protein [Actinomycetota bacterium]|nr:NUDIX domain-containing protein [Actinomycetota bacterium]